MVYTLGGYYMEEDEDEEELSTGPDLEEDEED
jgi:hypothetical protein